MIRWGIIGCGNVTEVKSGPALYKVPGSSLVAVMRRDREKAEDYARRHKVPIVHTDGFSLVSDPAVDAVYVATPPGSHMEYALAAIDARKPVYIEKPMALNHEECEIINKAAARAAVPVFVAYYRRALPGFLLVKKLLEEGAIGKPRMVHLELFKAPSDDEKAGRLPWRVDPSVSGGGHFFDLGSHQLDWLDYVFGPVVKIRSLALNQAGLYPAEDIVAAELLFRDDLVFNGLWCFNSAKENNRDIIEIIGSEGSLRFSTFSFEPIILTTLSGRKEFINERPEHVQYYLVEKIIAELEGRGQSPSTGISAARTSLVMDEIVAEYYNTTPKTKTN